MNTAYLVVSMALILCGSSPGCIRYHVSYTQELGRQMLDWHNTFRDHWAKKIIPYQHLMRAGNLRLMSWDDELATMAHRWISQCNIDEPDERTRMPIDECRDTDEYKVGQNVGFIQWTQKDLNPDAEEEEEEPEWYLPSSKVIFDHWVLQFKHLVAWDLDSWDNKVCCFAVCQLLWATTHRVGCSEVVYEHKGKLTRVLGCNYAPHGLIAFAPAYLRGFPCALCPNSTICGIHPKYPHLCGTEKDMEEHDFNLYLSGKKKAVTARTHLPEDYIGDDSTGRAEASLIILGLVYMCAIN